MNYAASAATSRQAALIYHSHKIAEAFFDKDMSSRHPGYSILVSGVVHGKSCLSLRAVYGPLHGPFFKSKVVPLSVPSQTLLQNLGSSLTSGGQPPSPSPVPGEIDKVIMTMTMIMTKSSVMGFHEFQMRLHTDCMPQAQLRLDEFILSILRGLASLGHCILPLVPIAFIGAGHHLSVQQLLAGMLCCFRPVTYGARVAGITCMRKPMRLV